MYWTDWGNHAKIERAYMDGSKRETLVNNSLIWPNGLVIDHNYNKLYWADAYEDTIDVLDFNTGKRDVVYNQKIFLCKLEDNSR